jgi:hypothetical protein
MSDIASSFAKAMEDRLAEAEDRRLKTENSSGKAAASAPSFRLSVNRLTFTLQ